MKTKFMRTFFVCLSIAFLFTLTDCSSSKKTAVTTGTVTWIPKDFNPKTSVLLIEKISFQKKQEAKMEEYMKANYPYKYEFADTAVLNDTNGKYADHNLYRFQISCTYFTHMMHQGFGVNERSFEVGAFDFNFYDRQQKINYPKTGKGASWASIPFTSMMNAVLKQTN